VNKKIIFVILIIAIFLIAVLRLISLEDTWVCDGDSWVMHGQPSSPMPITPCGQSRACTMEAKICPDGSAVGRSGPNCEFAACPEVTSLMNKEEALEIAKKSCLKGGETVGGGSYNPNSQTWWFDANLNSTKEGCNPACVVSAKAKTVEINWRCTGLKQPQ